MGLRPLVELCVEPAGKISCMKRVASPGSMHDTGCLGLVHWDDPEGWYGEGGGRSVHGFFGSFKVSWAVPFTTGLLFSFTSLPLTLHWILPHHSLCFLSNIAIGARNRKVNKTKCPSLRRP